MPRRTLADYGIPTLTFTVITPAAAMQSLHIRNAQARVLSWFRSARFTPQEEAQAIEQVRACQDVAELAAMEQTAMQQHQERAGVTV